MPRPKPAGPGGSCPHGYTSSGSFCAAKTTVNQLQSATNRLKLAARTRPYFVKVASGAWLGYRKPLSGPGAWAARVGNGEGRGWKKTLWQADDSGLKADGEKVLSFWQAKAEVQKLTGIANETTGTNVAVEGTPDSPVTLDEALKLYKTTLSERGARTSNAKRPRHHLSDQLLSKPVTLITEQELKHWRDATLADGSAPSSVNRTMTNLRAALTIACPDLTPRWRTVLNAIEDATEANKSSRLDRGAGAGVGRRGLCARPPARIAHARVRRDRRAARPSRPAANPRLGHD